MATLGEVRAALVDALDDLSGVNRYAYPEDGIEVPAAVVAGVEMTEIALGGLYDITAKVLVVVSRSHVSQLERLDELLDHTGAGSVVAAINDRRDADSISMSVTGVGDYGQIEWGGTNHYGAVITVRILT